MCCWSWRERQFHLFVLHSILCIAATWLYDRSSSLLNVIVSFFFGQWKLKKTTACREHWTQSANEKKIERQQQQRKKSISQFHCMYILRNSLENKISTTTTTMKKKVVIISILVSFSSFSRSHSLSVLRLHVEPYISSNPCKQKSEFIHMILYISPKSLIA